MREFQRGTGEKLIRVVCNRCGKEMRVENGCLKEGCFHGEAHFGYFSRKDGSSQQFDLCESQGMEKDSCSILPRGRASSFRSALML